jgi:hypothetical protein
MGDGGVRQLIPTFVDDHYALLTMREAPVEVSLLVDSRCTGGVGAAFMRKGEVITMMWWVAAIVTWLISAA